MELMKSFVDEEIVDPTLFTDTTNWVGDCYFTELCAMGLVGPWVVPEYATDFPEVAASHRSTSPLPTLENSSFAADSGWGLTVSSNSPEQELAWDFVSYVAQNAENALDWNLATGTLPALKANAQGDARDQLLADAAYLEPWLDLLDDAAVRRQPAGPRSAVLPGDRPERARRTSTGRRASEDALAAIEQEANSISQGRSRHGSRSGRAPPAADPSRVGHGGRSTRPRTGSAGSCWRRSCSTWRFFTLLPLVWVFALSFFNYSPRREGASIGGLGGDNPFVGLENFQQLFDFSDPSQLAQTFHTAVVVTLVFAFIVLPLNLLITLPLAVMIESVARRLRPLLRTVFFMPVLTSAVAVAVIWQYVLNPQYGLLNAHHRRRSPVTPRSSPGSTTRP